MELVCLILFAWPAGQATQNTFAELLQLGNESKDFTQAVNMLRGMSPTAIDQELRALQARLSCQAFAWLSVQPCETPVYAPTYIQHIYLQRRMLHH